MNNKDLKKFIKAIITVLFLVIVSDRLIGYGLEQLYNKQTCGLLYRTNIVVDSTTANILVFGSSRANHHYNPSIFEKETGKSFYNCGRDGTGFMYSAALINAVTTRYKPKVLIIDIIPNEFTEPEEGKLSPLLPYAKNSAIKPFFQYNGNFEQVKLLSKIYPYNSLFTNLIVGTLDYNKERSRDYKGFLALQGMMNTDTLEVEDEKKVLNKDKVKVFDELLTNLEKKGIRSVVVISPKYVDFKGWETVKTCSMICSNHNGTIFLNYLNTKTSRTKRYFKDSWHLNDTGSLVFSSDLAQKLKFIN